MDFGKVTAKELDQINFTLPADPAWNQQILPSNRDRNLQVYIGSPRWGVKEWLGKIYPKGIKDTQFLDYYVHQFNTIELNATHYQVFEPETISRWAEKAIGVPFFKFCPKFPQSISHYSSFENVEDTTNKFLAGIVEFKHHLGPVFLQVSEKYSPERRDQLFNYIASLPKDVRFFLEVRHQDWFSGAKVFLELLQFLKEQKVGLVITDTAGRRDCAHMHLSVPVCFVRFVANSLHPTDYTRIDEWVNRLTYWIEKGVQEIYFFIHTHNEVHSPELAVYLINKLNEATGLKLKKPELLQQTLF
ncbi:Uncharacterized conserved protein YecE, DUF72 family [Filimonas lacunae]|uniref:Uncharacterized conserved protein YecE, DUF72 family n=1 Tax=Filimonas lacunae TaxID=477680 RepID=A0A173MQG2_9BACT|nr:DUF72 domain-containing protein [Filimonas lacunae]BAV09727.1 hypothetical protein FLA_5780 [Filimonas lacunae]SIS77980.1 Uncharacterized conserved protein YecE, DUF72 family [Filimonas lacunae]